MREYGFSDYGIFSDAVSTSNSLSEKIESIKTKVSSLSDTISGGSVFMGPIADSCVEGFSEVVSNMTILNENFSKICDYLLTISSEYQLGDQNASSTVLELNYTGFKGKTASVASNAFKTVSQLNESVSSSFNNGQLAVASAYNNPSGLSGSNLDFINSIVDGAVDSYNEYGVLPSVTLAQAILESGWGKYSIGNNIFGIKAGSNWTGKVQNVPTYEQNADGSSYQIYANFRDYDSIADSIKDHGKLFTQDFYQPVLEASNYADACRAVKNCGYATAVDYADSLINIIESYGLDQWDPK